MRNAILDPLNWNGIGAGTAAQEWPAFNFPGPPAVVKAEVASASTIRLVFNNNLHLGSAGQLSNYTGIAGLSVATPTDNGALADTVTLIYQNAFSSGITYDLAVFGVADAEGRTMVDTFHYSFTYETQLGFENRFWVVTEGDGPVNIRLNLVNPAQTSVKLVYKSGGFSTAGFLDFSFENQTLEFTGTSELEINLEVPITDDNVEEQDEYFVLELVEPNGIALKGPSFITVYIQDNDRKAPEETLDIELSFVSRYAVDNPNGESGLAEIVAYDPGSKRLYTISTALKQFDIVDFSDPIAPQNVKVVDISPYGGGITSIAVKNGIVAVCVPGINNEQENGKVVFFDPDGNFINQVTVGALPDMIVFTPDGQKVITANEGQPNDAYTIDPEGSISLIDISGGIAGLTQDQVFTIGFTAFNPQTAELVASGVRLLKTTSTLAQDLEPEYVTISEDSQKAWATLQENNAMAEIDLATKTVTAIWPLGVKDYHETGNGLDLSDRSNEILIANWPVKGFYLPDAVANYSLNGKTYLFTANEGDEKEYSGLNERTTVSAIDLDPVAFPNAAMLKENHNMGRFRVTNLSGDKDNDGDFDELFCVGARSFSIWDAESHTLVYDSGDDFEKITAEDPYTAPIFNADNEGNGFKGRSRAKGPEPEGIVLAPINGREFAFITLERIGGVMVYDVTDPFHPEFTDYVNSRDNTTFAGDNGPEGIIYIPGAISPDGKSYIITANELSGTLAIFEIKNVMTSVSNPVLSGSKIQIYPNPNGSGRAYFSEPTGYTLFDLNGVALKWDIQAQSVDLNGLPKGMYLVRLADGAVQKLIVD